MPVLRAGVELDHHAPRLGLGDPGAQQLHPAVLPAGQQLSHSGWVFHAARLHTFVCKRVNRKAKLRAIVYKRG
jgi:hypothetical protein